MIKQLSLKFKNLSKRNKTTALIIHHRGGNGDVTSIHQQHLKQGWSGIGYHYYIRKDGTIYSGKPQWAIGAHCTNHNSYSLGICLEGNFEKEKPSEKQLESLKWLIQYLKKLFPIKEVKGHRDLNATACPGKYLYSWLSSQPPGYAS